MERQPRRTKWSDPDVGVLLDGLKYEPENDPKYPIATRALGLAMAVKKSSRHDGMGPTEYMTEDRARSRLVVIGGHAGVLDAAMKYLERVDAIATARVNVEDMAARVRRAAPRLAEITNLTAISFGFLEGAWTALSEADLSVENDYHEMVEHHRRECEWMTVIRLVLLLDRDEAADSFQSVYRCLQYPEVVDKLVRDVCDNQPTITEERVYQSISDFVRIYATSNWELHGRLVHFRNLGVAHLGSTLRKRPTYDDLRVLVRLVRDLAACLAPMTEGAIASVRHDEIADRTQMAARTWRAVLRKKK